jgi:hypothetical protein
MHAPHVVKAPYTNIGHHGWRKQRSAKQLEKLTSQLVSQLYALRTAGEKSQYVVRTSEHMGYALSEKKVS